MKKLYLPILLLFFTLLNNTQLSYAQKESEGGGGSKNNNTNTNNTNTNNNNTNTNIAKEYNPFGNRIGVEGLYSMDIAPYLDETNDLNDEASLQYNNTSKEVYIIVIDDDKNAIGDEYNLSSYFNFAIGNIKAGISGATVTGQKTFTLPSGSTCQQAIVTGSFNGIGVYYILSAIETPTHFYQALSWTLKENASLYGNDMQEMIKSFKQTK
ncbi:MAG: hypothetical protein EAZ55_02935 [Cytophagales bacterium]|nr:MAG: hypothetical protein EAZ55_02935 [Cytophagales bacterium]